jgi:hypothetical protein
VEAVFNQGELHKLGLDTLKQIIASLLPVPYQQLNSQLAAIFKSFSEEKQNQAA